MCPCWAARRDGPGNRCDGAKTHWRRTELASAGQCLLVEAFGQGHVQKRGQVKESKVAFSVGGG